MVKSTDMSKYGVSHESANEKYSCRCQSWLGSELAGLWAMANGGSLKAFGDIRKVGLNDEAPFTKPVVRGLLL